MDFNLVNELHGMITKSTLTPEGETPRMRKTGEDIYVVDNGDGKIYHKAPQMAFVKDELNKLILFANDELKHDFIHPITKAIMLHFWMGYLHPFTDGNGRLARLLFYWYLLKNEYWAFSYLPISKTLKKAPAQYSMAYVYSEQDESDMTYFIDFNIRKIKLAVNDFKEYVDFLSVSNKEMNKASETKYDLNERQIQLLQYLHGDPEERTSLKMHMNVYQIANKTAISDLKKLLALGLLSSKKVGRNVYYYATEKIRELFK
jgi:Fic family protein